MCTEHYGAPGTRRLAANERLSGNFTVLHGPRLQICVTHCGLPPSCSPGPSLLLPPRLLQHPRWQHCKQAQQQQQFAARDSRSSPAPAPT